MARRTLDEDHHRSEQMDPDQFRSSSPNPAAVERTGSHRTHRRAEGAIDVIYKEVLTYNEAGAAVEGVCENTRTLDS
jgi:hypothetical protein